MPDVKKAKNKVEFAEIEWIRRGWTLQELLAPQLVLFLSKNWALVGRKGNLETRSCDKLFKAAPPLETAISKITNIPRAVLDSFDTSWKYGVDASAPLYAAVILRSPIPQRMLVRV